MCHSTSSFVHKEENVKIKNLLTCTLDTETGAATYIHIQVLSWPSVGFTSVPVDLNHCQPIAADLSTWQHIK